MTGMAAVVRLMTEADLPLGWHLCRAAQWNQTENDWRRFLRLAPTGCCVAEVNGQGVGTAAAFRFGAIAWIAMVLVDPECRGQGVGTTLLTHVLRALDDSGCFSVRLDATDLGRPLYEKLGFVSQFTLARYEGVPKVIRRPGARKTERVSDTFFEDPSGDWARVLALDAAVTGTDRRALLAALRDEPGAWWQVGEGGFVATRPGVNAVQIGPCLGDEHCGAALLTAALAQHRGRRVFVDVPVDHAGAVAVVRDAGLVEQRRFTRMTRGKMVLEQVPQLWASSGPEKG